MGLLDLLGLLEGVLRFLALLEGGLKHGVPHTRRLERSADLPMLSFNTGCAMACQWPLLYFRGIALIPGKEMHSDHLQLDTIGQPCPTSIVWLMHPNHAGWNKQRKAV